MDSLGFMLRCFMRLGLMKEKLHKLPLEILRQALIDHMIPVPVWFMSVCVCVNRSLNQYLP